MRGPCFTVFAILALLLAPTALGQDLSAAGGHYAIAGERSSITFTISNLAGGALRGQFKAISGEIDFDATDAGRSTVAIIIDPASVDAGEPRTTAFLKSNAVFDVAHEKAITFRSTAVLQTGPASASVEGDLVARGKSGHEAFSVTVLDVNRDFIRFSVRGTVPRGRYGMDVGLPIYSNDVRFDMTLVGSRL